MDLAASGVRRQSHRRARARPRGTPPTTHRATALPLHSLPVKYFSVTVLRLGASKRDEVTISVKRRRRAVRRIAIARGGTSGARDAG